MNVKDFERRLSPMEIEEIVTRTKASSVEEKKVMVSVMPTDILEAELKRRNHIKKIRMTNYGRFPIIILILRIHLNVKEKFRSSEK